MVMSTGAGCCKQEGPGGGWGQLFAPLSVIVSNHHQLLQQFNAT